MSQYCLKHLQLLTLISCRFLRQLVPGKHTPWALITKAAGHASDEKHSVPSFTFLADGVSKLHQHDVFSTNAWIMSCNVKWTITLMNISLSVFALMWFNPEALVSSTISKQCILNSIRIFCTHHFIINKI